MNRFINEDHQAMTSELDAEMAKMGFIDDGSGNFVPAPRQQPVTPVNETQPLFNPEPEPLSQIQFTPQPTPTPQSQHNWEKREADARQAQRELSMERNAILEERMLLAREKAEAMATIQALQEQRTALEARASNIPAVTQQILTPEFRSEYPDIAAAIEQSHAANQAEIERIKLEHRRDQDEKALESETNRRKLFLDEVRRVHRDYDAIIASDVFKQWVQAQNRSTKLVLEETFNLSLGYEPGDLSDVLTRFKKALNPAHLPPPVPSALNSVDPGGRGADNGDEPSGASDFVFSVQEMRDPGLIDRWMNHYDHKKNRKLAMEKFDAAWERSVAFHNRNR